MLIGSDGLQPRTGSLTANKEWFKVWRNVGCRSQHQPHTPDVNRLALRLVDSDFHFGYERFARLEYSQANIKAFPRKSNGVGDACVRLNADGLAVGWVEEHAVLKRLVECHGQGPS